MLKTKSCYRCGGDVYRTGETELNETTCLQCGAVQYSKITKNIPITTAQRIIKNRKINAFSDVFYVAIASILFVNLGTKNNFTRFVTFSDGLFLKQYFYIGGISKNDRNSAF